LWPRGRGRGRVERRRGRVRRPVAAPRRFRCRGRRRPVPCRPRGDSKLLPRGYARRYTDVHSGRRRRQQAEVGGGARGRRAPPTLQPPRAGAASRGPARRCGGRCRGPPAGEGQGNSGAGRPRLGCAARAVRGRRRAEGRHPRGCVWVGGASRKARQKGPRECEVWATRVLKKGAGPRRQVWKARAARSARGGARGRGLAAAGAAAAAADAAAAAAARGGGRRRAAAAAARAAARAAAAALALEAVQQVGDRLGVGDGKGWAGGWVGGGWASPAWGRGHGNAQRPPPRGPAFPRPAHSRPGTLIWASSPVACASLRSSASTVSNTWLQEGKGGGVASEGAEA
jgi:hypothetical protein